MKVHRTEVRHSETAARLHRTLAAIAAVALTFGCSSGSVSTPPTPSPGVTSPSQAEVRAAVLSAWRAEHEAYAEALRAMDPDYPELAKTAIDPVLSGARSFITVSKMQGIVARGDQDLGSPQVVELTPADDPVTAVVESCIHDRLVLYDGRTGKPVPGDAGQVTWAKERTTLRLVSGIGWLVSDNQVRQGEAESVCD